MTLPDLRDRALVRGCVPLTAEEWQDKLRHGYASGTRGARRVMLLESGGTVLADAIVVPADQIKEKP